MKWLLSFAGGAVMSLVVAGSGSPQANLVAGDPGFRSFLAGFEEGTRRFINGDAALWKQHVSRRDDVTIMGGFGGYEKGWSEVGPRYDWAATRFRESGATLTVDYLGSAVIGDLAYTVSIERSEAHLVGQDRSASMALRVTHVFVKENGDWKLVHRHADHLVEKAEPPSLLAQRDASFTRRRRKRPCRRRREGHPGCRQGTYRSHRFCW